MRRTVAAILLAIAAFVSAQSSGRQAGPGAGVNGRNKPAPFPALAAVPSRDFVNSLPAISIDQFGAIAGDNSTAAALKNAAAIQAAVQASANNAGVAVVPAGKSYDILAVSIEGLVDAALRIDGNLSVHQNISAWPCDNPPPCKNNFKAVISIQNTVGFALLGSESSIIEGHGLEWWWSRVLVLLDSAPNLIDGNNNTNALISGVRTSNSPRFNMYWGNSHSIEFSDVRIFTDWDGIVQTAEETGAMPSHEAARSTVAAAVAARHSVPSTVAHAHVDAWLDRVSARGSNAAAGASFSLRWLANELSGEQPEPFPGIPMYPLNTDGIDVAGETIWIHDCNVENWDDSYCAKPQQLETAGCTQDLCFEDSIVQFGVGASMGSVPPDDGVNCIRRVQVRNISFTAPTKTLYVKTNGGNHGTGLIEDVHYSEIHATDGIWYPVYVGPQQQKEPDGGGDGWWPATQPRVTVGNITFESITMENVVWPQPGVLRCNITNPCTGIDFHNVSITSELWNSTDFQWVCNQTLGVFDNLQPLPKCFNGPQ